MPTYYNEDVLVCAMKAHLRNVTEEAHLLFGIVAGQKGQGTLRMKNVLKGSLLKDGREEDPLVVCEILDLIVRSAGEGFPALRSERVGVLVQRPYIVEVLGAALLLLFTMDREVVVAEPALQKWPEELKLLHLD